MIFRCNIESIIKNIPAPLPAGAGGRGARLSGGPAPGGAGHLPGALGDVGGAAELCVCLIQTFF